MLVIAVLAGLLHPSALPALEEGESIPEVVLRSAEGRYVSLRGMRSGALVINFWATWCPPCREEIPHLAGLYDKYQGRGVHVVGITSEDENAVRAFIQKRPMPYPVLLDTGSRAHKLFGVSFVPVTFVVDRTGVIRTKFAGPVEAARLQRAVDEVLK